MFKEYEENYYQIARVWHENSVSYRGYQHVKVDFPVLREGATFEENSLNWPSSNPLDGFEIYSQHGGLSDTEGYYAIRMQVRDNISSVERAKKVVKVLTKVERALEKHRSLYGYKNLTVREYLAVICQVFKIDYLYLKWNDQFEDVSYGLDRVGYRESESLRE